MTWGPLMMCYICPKCGKKFKYEFGRMSEFGSQFGLCPVCNVEGTYDHDGARSKNDEEFEEVL